MLQVDEVVFWRRVLASPNGAVGAAMSPCLSRARRWPTSSRRHSPVKMGVGKRFAPPTLAYPLGTDEFGRDMLSRILYGIDST